MNRRLSLATFGFVLSMLLTFSFAADDAKKTKSPAKGDSIPAVPKALEDAGFKVTTVVIHTSPGETEEWVNELKDRRDEQGTKMEGRGETASVVCGRSDCV